MALPRVDVQIQNGGLGLVSKPDDRVCGLILSGTTGDPAQFFSFRQYQQLVNPTGAPQTSYGLELENQVRDFFLAAGDGAELWTLSVDPAATMANLFLGGHVSRLLDAADGRINVLGIRRYLEGGDAPSILEGLNADVLNALDEAQATAESFAAQYKPLRIILDGNNLVNDPSSLRDLKTGSYNRVGVCIGTNRANDKNAAIGLLLGRIAACAPNTNIGRVKDGAVPTDNGYFTNGRTVKDVGLLANAMTDKGYIFFRQFVGKSGFYWNDDHMATAATDDFYSLANGRVIDKAARVIYNTFVEEVLETVPVDENGKIVKTVLKQYQEKAERAIGLTMGAAGEISFVECFIDPSQDILATSELVIDVRITPTGTNRIITITLGLFNPNVTA